MESSFQNLQQPSTPYPSTPYPFSADTMPTSGNRYSYPPNPPSQLTSNFSSSSFTPITNRKPMKDKKFHPYQSPQSNSSTPQAHPLIPNVTNPSQLFNHSVCSPLQPSDNQSIPNPFLYPFMVNTSHANASTINLLSLADTQTSSPDLAEEDTGIKLFMNEIIKLLVEFKNQINLDNTQMAEKHVKQYEVLKTFVSTIVTQLNAQNDKFAHHEKSIQYLTTICQNQNSFADTAIFHIHNLEAKVEILSETITKTTKIAESLSSKCEKLNKEKEELEKTLSAKISQLENELKTLKSEKRQ